MFLLTQFVGLWVFLSQPLPDFLNPNIDMSQTPSYGFYFYQIISSFIFAFLIFVLITKYRLKLFMKLWFFFVVALALSISIFAIIKNFLPFYSIALIIGILLGLLKIYRPSIVIHNATEVLIYPGIATLFIPILNPLYMILLLIAISIYDVWAVWHSGIMLKMAKFQMNELKVFGGFFIPYLTKNIRDKIKLLKQSKKKSNKKIKVRLAILGGGDVVFPIITAGVFLTAFGLGSAIAVIIGAFAGLCYIMFFGENKPYPAMPYITAGIFIALLVWFLATII